MPWKNGGGTTLEIAIRPHDAAWAGFDWRMSIAEIESDGPFSTFAGIDRTLVVLAGRGMRLTGIRDEALDVRPYDLVTFAGEAQIESRLLDGPTRDLNVMTRRPVRADVRVVQGERFAWTGAAAYVCHAASRSCACVVGDSTVEVREAHTLVCRRTAVRGRCFRWRRCRRRPGRRMRFGAHDALLPEGWSRRVVIDVDDGGLIRSVVANSDAGDAHTLAGPVVPAMPNVHSHAFQRAIAGRTGRSSPDRADSFWSWREAMYASLERIDRRRVRGDRGAGVRRDGSSRAMAASPNSTTCITTPTGTPYADPAELAMRVAAAAARQRALR